MGADAPVGSTAERLQGAGKQLEKGGRLLEQNAVPGATGVKELGREVTKAGRSGEVAKGPLSTLADRASQVVSGVRGAVQSLGDKVTPAVQQGMSYVEQGLGNVAGAAAGPMGVAASDLLHTRTEGPNLGTPSPANQAWINQQGAVDPVAKVTVENLASPGGKLNEVFTAAGIDPTKGEVTQMPGYGPLPGIPGVEYTLTQEQYDKLKDSQPGFDLTTTNDFSTSSGQEENLGMRTDESYTKGDETLWRMAAYPPDENGNRRVVIYGEAVPEDSVGAAFHDDNGDGAGYREEMDRPVGMDRAEFAQWAVPRVAERLPGWIADTVDSLIDKHLTP